MPGTPYIGLLIASFFILSLTACERLKVDDTSESVRLDGETAAIVNNEPLYAIDIELEAVAQGIIQPGEIFLNTHEQYQTILDQLIDQRLLAQEAISRNLDLDETARHRLAIARERILGNLLVESLVADEVTEEAIHQMYNEQVSLQQLDDEVRISLITVPDEATANTLIKEHKNGAEFSALAFKYSTDAATRIEGGDLGYIGPTEQPDPFAGMIANTAVGEISDAFQVNEDWHVLKVEDRRQRPPKTLEQMRPEIVTFLTYSQINKILRDLRTNASIKAPRIATAPAEPIDENPATSEDNNSATNNTTLPINETPVEPAEHDNE